MKIAVHWTASGMAIIEAEGPAEAIEKAREEMTLLDLIAASVGLTQDIMGASPATTDD